jgi:hypothetical protein
MADELRVFRNALDDLLSAAEAVVEADGDWPPIYDANMDNLSDAIDKARTLLYNPDDPMLNMSIEQLRDEIDEFEKAAELAGEGM